MNIYEETLYSGLTGQKNRSQELEVRIFSFRVQPQKFLYI